MSSRTVVIGLVGGIGSGKSTVARELARLGAHVSDSDAQARLVLQEPAVRDQLVARWGRGILALDGSVDRQRVAQEVFSKPDERRFLESLIHPELHRRRAQALAQARAQGVRAFVIDAPLLFEAGVDRECDAVIFVDAPRHERLARVARRGWDEQELDRRERAQMTLDEKRARSGYTVINSGPEIDLPPRVQSIYREILGEHAH